VFSSLTFKSKKVILKKEDFINNVLVVNLEVFTNELSEVLILAKKQLNPIQGGTQKYVDMKFLMMRSHLLKSKHFNLINMENGTDFVGYTRTYGYFERKIPRKPTLQRNKLFRGCFIYSYLFFSNTLALSDDEIKLFLVFFVKNDPKSRMVMNPNDQFKLMDF
jgi:hypothetical protein